MSACACVCACSLFFTKLCLIFALSLVQKPRAIRGTLLKQTERRCQKTKTRSILLDRDGQLLNTTGGGRNPSGCLHSVPEQHARHLAPAREETFTGNDAHTHARTFRNKEATQANKLHKKEKSVWLIFIAYGPVCFAPEELCFVVAPVPLEGVKVL